MRKKKEEETAMWDEYMEQRKQARIKEEEDLKKLKERQVSIKKFIPFEFIGTTDF